MIDATNEEYLVVAPYGPKHFTWFGELSRRKLLLHQLLVRILSLTPPALTRRVSSLNSDAILTRFGVSE